MGKKAKFLVIDDQTSEVKMINVILEHAGYEVVCVPNGKDEIEKDKKEDFDLIITGMVMPDIGGMKVLHDVKRSKPNLPVVMMTGHASIKTAVLARKLGTHHYFEKVFTGLELICKIDSALYKAKKQQTKEQKLIPQRRDKWLEYQEQSEMHC